MNVPQPPGAPPERTALVALLLALAGALVAPGLAVGLAIAFDREAQVVIGLLFFAGAASLIAAVILAFVALSRRRGRRGHAIAALVVSALGVPIGLVAGTLALLMTTPMLPGRPHRVGGRPRRSRARDGAAWGEGGLARAPETSGLAADVRDALARAWLDDASLEHASIAAFSALSLDLVALGATPALVAGAHRAALDEVEHARACFALASAYAGRPLTAAPFPDARAPLATETWGERVRRVAVESAIDGCIGEGAAAAIAREATEAARDPSVAAVLARIARDEQAHADLARAVLAWCIGAGGEPVRAAVEDALAREPVAIAPRGIAAASDLAEHGRAGEARWIAARASARGALAATLRALAA